MLRRRELLLLLSEHRLQGMEIVLLLASVGPCGGGGGGATATATSHLRSREVSCCCTLRKMRRRQHPWC